MANYPVNKIRNVCLMGHGGDGKTSLVESLLNISGATDRVGHRKSTRLNSSH